MSQVTSLRLVQRKLPRGRRVVFAPVTKHIRWFGDSTGFNHCETIWDREHPRAAHTGLRPRHRAIRALGLGRQWSAGHPRLTSRCICPALTRAECKTHRNGVQQLTAMPKGADTQLLSGCPPSGSAKRSISAIRRASSRVRRGNTRIDDSIASNPVEKPDLHD
jgi:hypothetical protein